MNNNCYLYVLLQYMILGYRETIVKIRGEIWEVNLRRRKTITHYNDDECL